jgi:predicted  nucleic acid-binding Zn-ribbon protein
MSRIDLLYRLQQLDDEIRDDNKRLAVVIRLQKESQELLEARARAAGAAEELRTWRTRQNDLNLEFRGLTDKIKRSEDRLYSGLVKNPKELADLQHEVESLGRRRGVLEDDLLEAMITVEESQEEDARATESLGQIQEEWEQSQIDLRDEQATLTERLRELQADRERQLDNIPPQDLSAYEREAKRPGGLAVVLLRNGRCLGCQVTVPANLAKLVDQGQLVKCDSCGRILFQS